MGDISGLDNLAPATTAATPFSPTFGASAAGSFTTEPRTGDPYRYQTGFGNRFATEAVPGALPSGGQNVPQKCRYDLYSEQLNGTSFISSRQSLQHVWMYRVRPSVAHRPLERMALSPDLEACFAPQNPNVHYTPLTYTWGPLDIPEASQSINFYQGIKTMGGRGDPTIREGVAVHMYAANTSMGNEAFCNNDGDMLIIPQVGRLDVQTELGRVMVRPGEIFVMQAGIRFRVLLPDGAVHGYIQEIFGSHYELPEMGPVGTNGLAHPRDFEMPVASFDIDESKWTIVHKLTGELYCYDQAWTPFDVVAWHGNYVPYKYLLEKFVALSSSMKEQLDPTIYTVLMAKSKWDGVSLTEFAVFTPKWATATNTFRPPYYHRNMATEIGGLICGKYGGSAREQEAGGLTLEHSYMPHGESYEAWVKATTTPLEPMLVGVGSIGFMLHLSSHFSVTKFAMERHNTIKIQRPEFWDNMKGHFLENLAEVNKALAESGLPALGTRPA
ncbi:putative homogentisate 1,2-dioxygenase [Mytilinidion resinicola]|uniref:homogentisate 1,2-dioxygenase n=1 Tax=Mytilinidion resinicola TaxID=574789 RepID=A0A6A6YSG4_9PEZI|nr:putative homogentisate 1,2-dioxygenase [Mytilinidion resinicola]KAF2811740.1 putative homogentisate 1,2-dioxygenase [Mytilinidion resinicola]